MDMETYDPNACPKCGSSWFDVVDRQSDSTHIWQYLTCNKCDQSWTEEYTLSGAWLKREDN